MGYISFIIIEKTIWSLCLCVWDRELSLQGYGDTHRDFSRVPHCASRDPSPLVTRCIVVSATAAPPSVWARIIATLKSGINWLCANEYFIVPLIKDAAIKLSLKISAERSGFFCFADVFSLTWLIWVLRLCEDYDYASSSHQAISMYLCIYFLPYCAFRVRSIEFGFAASFSGNHYSILHFHKALNLNRIICKFKNIRTLQQTNSLVLYLGNSPDNRKVTSSVLVPGTWHSIVCHHSKHSQSYHARQV